MGADDGRRPRRARRPRPAEARAGGPHRRPCAERRHRRAAERRRRGAWSATPPRRARPRGAGRARRQSGADSAIEPAPSSAPALGLPVPSPVTPSTSRNRSVERGATLRLATTPRRLDDVATRVVRVTDGVGGFVRSSAVDSRPAWRGRDFELQVPVRRLSTALARLSQLASVRSRNEGSLDVTEQVEHARDRVAGLKAERRSLLRQLSGRRRLDETARIRARLRSIESRLDTRRRSAPSCASARPTAPSSSRS